MQKTYDHLFILATIVFTVYSQMIMRWQVSSAGPLPNGIFEKVTYVWSLLINPWVFTGIMATFFAGVSWMLTMTRFEISYAFPFVSLNYIIILMAGFLLFNESLSFEKVLGCFFVILGILVIARG